MLQVLIFIIVILFVLRLFFWLLGLFSWLLMPMLFFWIVMKLWNFIRGGSSSSNKGQSSSGDDTNRGGWRRSDSGWWYTTWTTGSSSRSGQNQWSRNYGGYNSYNTHSGSYGGEQARTQNAAMTRDKALSIFGLPSTATSDEIRKRYRELVKKYHPDKLGNDATPEVRKAAEERFASINAAHAFLTQ